MTIARHLCRVALPLVLALAAGSTFGGCPPARAQDPALLDPAKLTTPPLRRVQAPRPERYVMPNGVVVFLLEDHTLPVVRARIQARTSPLWIPAEKTGLGSVAGDVLRSGGSAAHSGDWLDDRLAAIGASMYTGIEDDQTSCGFRCLRENTAEMVGLFAEVLRAPAFPEDKIELAKVGLRQSIASRNDELLNILIRTATEAVYGKDNPYARKPEYATVEAITRADCQELHARVFQPNRMVLAVYGDFKPAEMKKLLAAKFGDWKRGAGAAMPPPPMPGMAPARLVFAPKDDVTQTGVIISHLGFRADDPDYAAMNVYGMALGGGFQSRLVNKIRTERGLAYASGAVAGADYIRPGVFLAYSLTRNDSALTALGLLRDETRKTTEAPFTPEELKTAIESESNGLVFSFAEPSAILFRTAFYEMAGYPLDFLDRYQKSLEGVTADGVLAAARRKVHPDQFVAVVVGKESEFERPLESMGLPVERVDITIPPPPSKLAVATATPEALARGQAALRRAADLAGGSAAWAAVKSVAIESSETMHMAGQSLSMTGTTQWRLPDHLLAVRQLPMGEIKQGCDGTTGWMAAMGQLQEQPKAVSSLKEEYERSFFRLFGEPGAYEVQLLDQPKVVDGVRYAVAVVKSANVKDWMLYFAPDGQLARTEYVGEGMGGAPARATEIYGDWKDAGTVKWPYSTQTLMDDKPVMESTVTKVTLNPALGDELFRKPTQ
jgi:zinc protease